MLRIVHISMFPVSLKSLNLHAVSIKLSNGFTRNGHEVINLSDRDIARGLGFGHRKLGKSAANREIRALCRSTRPDLLVLGHAHVVDASTIAALREDLPGLRVAQWNVDPLFEPNNVKAIESCLDVVDATLISTAGPALDQFRRPGKLVGFLPNPVDLSIERGRLDLVERPEFDMFYACNNPASPERVVCGQAWHMESFITALRAKLPCQVTMSLPGMFGQPRLNGAAYHAELGKAGIGLNISRRADYPLYSSDRLAHLCGNGLMVLIERATGYDRLFGEDEMGFFSTLDEQAELLGRLVSEPARRMRAAAAGRARYVELFNERRMAAYVVDAALGEVDPAAYPWPDPAA